jgi:hypothetical protein
MGEQELLFESSQLLKGRDEQIKALDELFARSATIVSVVTTLHYYNLLTVYQRCHPSMLFLSTCNILV